MVIRKFKPQDTDMATEIWNSVVDDGIAFPQMNNIKGKEALQFFDSQSYTGIAEDNGEIVGLYILHPNNVGRCGHICNTSIRNLVLPSLVVFLEVS